MIPLFAPPLHDFLLRAVNSMPTPHPLKLIRSNLMRSNLISRKAAPAEIVHAVPALHISLRAEFRIATRGIIEAFDPTLLIPLDQFSRFMGDAVPENNISQFST
jgi:hypothetical protein